MIISRFPQYINIEEIKALYYSKKDIVNEFEKKFAKTVGNKYALTFPYGRSALFSILKSLNIEKKNILIPSYTCAVVSSIVVESGNVPIFTDISLSDYNMVLDDALKKISKKTGAIIPVHTYGYPVDIKELKQRINEDIYIIEDAALALLTKNTGKYSDVTFYSLDFMKQLYSAGGGIVTTNNKNIYDKMKEYISKNFKKKTFYNETKKLLNFLGIYFASSKLFFKPYDIHYNYSIKKIYSKYNDQSQSILPNDYLSLYCNFQAKIGLSQLKKIHDIVKKSTLIANYYNDELEDIKNIKLPPIIEGASYSKYTIRIKKRDEFKKVMEKKGVYLDNLWGYSIPHLSIYKKFLNNEKFSNSLLASQSVINLPNYSTLYDNTNELEYIVKTIKNYFKTKPISKIK